MAMTDDGFVCTFPYTSMYGNYISFVLSIYYLYTITRQVLALCLNDPAYTTITFIFVIE